MDPDFELRWPRWLFVEEARRLLGSQNHLDELRTSDPMSWTTSTEMLLEEAFTSTVPHDLFNEHVIPAFLGDPDRITPSRFLGLLVEHASELSEAIEPRAYWSQRHNPQRESVVVTLELFKTRFVELIAELDRRGYLAQRWPQSCVDDRDGVTVDRALALEQVTGLPGLWPLRSSYRTWDGNTFFDLIEIFHDVVSRPTGRHFHDYGDCGYHWSGFATGTARRLYRWRINTLLGASEVSLELAESGEDEGRLVTAAPDARRDLIAATVERTDPGTRKDVRHAIALFRNRTADVPEKRSAIIALAGVLETRRSLLKEELFSKDEGALFQIANRFAIRHQNASQQANYDVAFLDWVFWWYLATIELSDRLLARQQQASTT